MCPLTKEPCSNDFQWFTKLFTNKKDGKEYFGCIIEKIEMALDSIADNTASIDMNTMI
jgi:hypothetical protein